MCGVVLMYGITGHRIVAKINEKMDRVHARRRVCSLWRMVYGVWCMVYGVWCMVYDLSYMVCGLLCMVCCVLCVYDGVWYKISGRMGCVCNTGSFSKDTRSTV